MKHTIEPWSAELLYKRRNLIQYPDFQREPNVWSPRKRQLLIDSMLIGLDIPKIYLFKSKTSDQYDCVDGQQRIESVFAFFDGDLTLPDGRNWDRLTIKEQEIISNYEFTIALITKATDKELRLLFLRLQLGAPLNVGEKLHAMTGDMRDFVFDLGKNHPFFKKVRIPKRRFAKETVFAQICINSFYRSLHESFHGARYEDLKIFFEQFSNLNSFKEEIELIQLTLEKLDRYFGDNASLLRNRAVIVSAYLFSEELIKDKKMDLLEDFTEFYLRFIEVLKDQTLKGLEYDREYREILDFQSHIIQAAVGKSAIEARHEMLKYYFEYYRKTKEIKRLDASLTV
jgi:hypothetical protein